MAAARNRLDWVAVGMMFGAAAYAAPTTLYVAPEGNDAWSGRAPQANAAKTDGPLASAIGARNLIRRLRAQGQAEYSPRRSPSQRS